jgi:protein disulfide-isomerase A1
MKGLLILSLLFCAVVGQVDDPDVLVLTAENFDATIAQNNLILVEFYAPWCGHCKHLAPEYAKAATTLKGVVPLAKVDADAEVNKELAQRFGIRGFPTLKLFRGGQPVDYPGDRTADAIVSYLKKQTLPAVSILESVEKVNQFSTEERVVIIGFFDSETSPEFEKFKQTAEALRESFIFGAVVGKPDINKEFSVDSTPAVILFKQFDEGKNILAAKDFDNLEHFIKTNSVPLIDEIGPHNFKNYMNQPLGYLFVDLTVDGQKDKYVEMIRSIAEESKGKLNWVYIDWAKYARHAERLGLSGKTVPCVALENMDEGTHYAYDETAELNTKNIAAWVKTFLDGTLAPTIKSEEIPAENNGPVKVVVAKTFDQIVNDKTKDVLLEFYAPWCGHCKSLAPIYEEVGAAFSSSDNVVVAKIDATANDVSPKLGIRGFPTLKFFPANNKESPIDYEGDRSKDDLINFIKQHASVKVDGKDEL